MARKIKEQLLNKLPEQKECLMTATTEKEPVILEPLLTDLPQEDEIRVVFDFFQGIPKQEISIKYHLEPKSINSLIQKYQVVATSDLVFKKREIEMARENDRIMSLKSKIYTMVEMGIEDAMVKSKTGVVMVDPKTGEERVEDFNLADYFTKTKDILGKMDDIFRLNAGMATQNIHSTNTTTTIDANKALEQLQTPEDKLRFLQEQIRPNTVK